MIQEVFQPKKLFNLAEANATLPLVSRVVGDIVRAMRDLEAAEATASEGEAPRERGDLEALRREFRGYLDELEEIGCILKDPLQGLIDFPARLDDRVVFLCWKLGEPAVEFWHEVESGFAGRRPVAGDFQGVQESEST